MSRLLLCISPLARCPYYLEEAGVRIYSAEELCYYIEKNVLLIEEGFFDEALLDFLGRELQLSPLAEKLREIREDSLDSQLYLFLKEVGYHTDQELEAITRTLEKKRLAKPWELQKSKADYMVSRKKYESAVRLYDSILENAKEYGLTAAFLGGVYHNKGVALLRSFFFAEAARCLEQAYSCTHDEGTLKELFGLKLLDPGTGISPELFAEVPAQLQFQWKEEFELMKNQSYYEGKSADASAAFLRDSLRRPVAVRELLRDWKKECKEMA